ncbi:MAG: undecaprenyl-diphosphate phosphatase [Caulobacterales bacterium]|jgi:undecaprenyl-diphosphatase
MTLIEFLQAVMMGFVEGMTEFLPVSSTAHLILLGKALGFDDPTGAFKVMIQLGAILAIITVYFQKIWQTVIGLPSSAEARRFGLCVGLAFLPAAAAGVLVGDIVEKLFLEGEVTPLALNIIASTLLVGGVIMLGAERVRPPATTHSLDDLPVWKAVVVGACQCLALVPGVSRSGASIVGAMMLGVERKTAAEFSFFLAMPTMLAAFTYSFVKNRDMLDGGQIGIIAIGFAAAFVAGLIVVKLFLSIVGRYGFAPFAWYRIGLGLLIFALVGMGLL